MCVESFRLGLGELHVPGPGFFPFLAGMAFAAFSIALAVQTLRKGSPIPSRDWYSEVLWGRWGIVLTCMLAYAFLLERLGFIICTIFFITAVMVSVRPRSWKMALVVATTGAAASYLIFQLWLKSQLPPGILRI